MWGIGQTLGPRGKIPMCLLPLLIPTTFIKKGSWWLRQLWSWKWGGRTVSPHPHAHSTHNFCCSSLTQTFFSGLHEFDEHPCTAISCPPCGCSPSCTSNCLLIVFTHRNFPGFTHAVFPPRIENGVAPSFTHRLNCGFDIVIVHAPVGRL